MYREGLAQAMDRMCASRARRLRMGENAQKRVKAYYRKEEMIEKYRNQASTVSGSNVVTIKTKTLSLSEREEVNRMLVDKFGVDEATIESQSIGSTISNEMRSNAVKALIVACIFMLFYIWFRFKDIRFAGSAIIALVHDVLVMLTGYALIRISVGNTFIACVLTIVGYSINDTIVIFDRIRENMQGMKKQTAIRN